MLNFCIYLEKGNNSRGFNKIPADKIHEPHFIMKFRCSNEEKIISMRHDGKTFIFDNDNTPLIMN